MCLALDVLACGAGRCSGLFGVSVLGYQCFLWVGWCMILIEECVYVSCSVLCVVCACDLGDSLPRSWRTVYLVQRALLCVSLFVDAAVDLGIRFAP